MLVKTHPRLPETHVHVPTGSAGLWGLPSEYLGSWISVAWSIVYVTGVVSQNATKRERGDRVTPPPKRFDRQDVPDLGWDVPPRLKRSSSCFW